MRRTLAPVLLVTVAATGCVRHQAEQVRDMGYDVRNYARHQMELAPYLSESLARYLNYQVELAARLTHDLKEYARNQAGYN